VLVDDAGAAFPTVKVDTFKECDAADDAAVQTKVEVRETRSRRSTKTTICTSCTH